MRRLLTWFPAFLLLAVIGAAGLFIYPPSAQAAEVLQVRSGTLLQVGDQNRNYSVRIACIEVSEAKNDQATAWLRSQLPRRSKVNLKPTGQESGVMVAQVQKLSKARSMGNAQSSLQANDMGSGLVEAGLAEANCPAAAS